MKETIIIIVVILLIFGGDILINKYLKNSSQDLIKELKDLKTAIDKNLFGEKEVLKRANQIYSNWQKTEEKWAIFVLHSELDQIEIALIKMKTQIEENNLDVAKEELETSMFLIDHISEKEKFKFKNIF